MGMSSFLISGTMQQFCGLSSTAFVFGDSSQSKLARNAWCRQIVPFCKELGSDNLTQECQLGGSLAGKLSARVLSIALSFLCASLHSSIPRSSA
jgi:phage terminase large subunit-like protein